MLDKTMAEKNLYAVMDGDKGQKVCWSAEFGWDRWDLCHGVHGVCCNLQICIRALGFTAPPFPFRKVQKLQHAIEEATAAPW